MDELDQLKDELEKAKAFEGEYFQDGSTKEEMIELIQHEIDRLEEARDDADYESDEDVESERVSICLSQGLSRYC